MKLFQQLNEELCTEMSGIYAPEYFRYLGFTKAFSAKPPVVRANGIYALFTEPKPVIMKNELIAGNTRCLYTDANPDVVHIAKRAVSDFGARNFHMNKDHYAPAYDHFLQTGLPGMIAEVDASLQKHHEDAQKVEMLEAMRHTLCGFTQMIENYIAAAEECKGKPGYEDARLEGIIANSKPLLEGKPQTFAQALQLMWYCHTAFLLEGRYAMAFGRLDQFLYPFYKADIEKGILTDEEVIELLENIFIRLQDDVVNICIGGQNARGECQVNPLTWCVLWAVRNCNVPGPNLSLRLTENTPDEFLDECLKVIGTGLGYPALMNDDVNIAALKRYPYEEEDVYNYSMVGCIENFITGMQPPWSDWRFDTPRYFEYLFNRGVPYPPDDDARKTLFGGIDTGDLKEIRSMDDFMKALEKQIAFGVETYVALFDHRNNRINQRYYPEPFLSCFCHDCIGRGLDINDGGSKYPSVHGVGAMGIATMADSLAAIEKVVFIDQKVTLEELRDALNANFEGYEDLQKDLLAAPKYGNNDDFADKYAVWFIDYLASQFDQYHTRDGGWYYVAAATNTANIGAGHRTNATPDGRKRGEPLSDAASPTYGRDVRGATAAAHSLAKPDYTKVACGSVVNQKFSPSMFSDEKRGKLLALIRAYFKKGSQELQINSTSREILEDAMEHPEKYPNLVVRVSGFSAFYVTLDPAVQQDILNRTQQE